MKYSFKKYILLSIPVFRQQVHIRAKEKPTGIAGGSSYAAQGPILPAARLRACGLFTCILLLATRKRVFKIQC